MRITYSSALALIGAAMLGMTAQADDVNVYSSRHYDSDDALYDTFTKETGITVNRIEGKADELMARMQAEGANSPADVLITVDVGRMERAEGSELLAPFASDIVAEKVPSHLRHPGDLWFGIAQRVRMIFYAKDRVDTPPQSYEELADPKWKGKVCIRSSGNVYNQSLLASLIEIHGGDAARDWAQGVVDNMARPPQGGDTDQLRGLVSGECDVAVANHYYFVRGLAGDVDGLSEKIDSIGWVFPNQEDRGAHVNLTTAALTKHAPNAENAAKLLNYLLSPEAQEILATQSHEYPVVAGTPGDEATERLGTFKADETTPTAAFSQNAASAQKIFNEVGWD